MATVNIPIFRQDYAQSGETPSQQFAGVEPNVFSPSLSGVTLASTSADKNLIGDPSYSTYGIDDFKDHKTIFVFKNAGASASVTFKAGDTYAGREAKDLEIGSGEERIIWLDSSKFADKSTGVIEVTTSGASVTAYGVELR